MKNNFWHAEYLHLRKNSLLMDAFRTVFKRFSRISSLSSFKVNKKKLHGLSPRANYTDRATAFKVNISLIYCTSPANTEISLGSLISFYPDN
jgi:hypothetical protein